MGSINVYVVTAIVNKVVGELNLMNLNHEPYIVGIQTKVLRRMV